MSGIDDPRLLILQEKRRQLRRLYNERTISYKIWSTAKFYSRKLPWFNDFIHDRRIPFEELEYYINFGSLERELTREEVEQVWDKRKAILNEIEALETEICEMLHEFLYSTDISTKKIAKYYEASQSAIYKFLKDRPGYKRRREVKLDESY